MEKSQSKELTSFETFISKQIVQYPLDGFGFVKLCVGPKMTKRRKGAGSIRAPNSPSFPVHGMRCF